MTTPRAHKLFHIPKTKIFYHLNGIRSQKSNSQGRTTVIPREDETRLTNGLRGLEKWGFGITRLLKVAEKEKIISRHPSKMTCLETNGFKILKYVINLA